MGRKTTAKEGVEKKLKGRSLVCTASRKGPGGCIVYQQGSTQQPYAQQVDQVALVSYGLLDWALTASQLIDICNHMHPNVYVSSTPA